MNQQNQQGLTRFTPDRRERGARGADHSAGHRDRGRHARDQCRRRPRQRRRPDHPQPLPRRRHHPDRDPDPRVLALVAPGLPLQGLRPHRRHHPHVPADRERRDRDLDPGPGEPAGHRRLAEPAGLPDGGRDRRRDRGALAPRRHRSPLADSSGNNNTGNIVGGVATGQPGAVVGQRRHHDQRRRRLRHLLGARSPRPPRSPSRCGSRRPPSGAAPSWASPTPRPASASGTTAPSTWTTTARSSFGIRRGNVANPGNSFVRSLGHLQRRQLAPGRRRVQRDHQHLAVHGRRPRRRR